MPNSEDTLLVPSRRRSSSFSSLSTLSSDSPLSPETILQTGVPFSWEKLPGIPKNETQLVHTKKESSSSPSSTTTNLLVLPPPPTARSNRFNTTDQNSRSKKTSTLKHVSMSKKDPFLAAFVECSKDHNYHHQVSKNMKIPPTSSFHKFNLFSLYAICKTSGPVSESIVYLPKSKYYI